jgi:DNA recombination protein RmuC
MRYVAPDARGELAKAQQDVARLTGQITGVQDECTRLRAEVAAGRTAETARSALEATVAAAKNELALRDERIKSLTADLAEAGNIAAMSAATVATLRERNAALQAEVAKRLQEVEELQKRLTVEFENIANRVLEKTSSKLSESSQEKLTTLLDPLKTRIQEFQQKVEQTYDTERIERLSLRQELKGIMVANQMLGDQASKLTNALRGEGQKRGRWGELVLERILESSGLQKGREYVAQAEGLRLRSDDGNLQRPDVIVYLPEKKHIVIDSKVTLLSYERYLEATDDADRIASHAEFLGAVKRHVEDLATKSYQDNAKLSAHEFVLMFMPIEGALALAMKDNDGLFEFAWTKRVAIVGPTSLLMTLKVVSTIWRYQRQGENAADIASRAALLYDKLRGFVEDLNVVSTKLKEAKTTFDDAMSKLSTGQGNAFSQLKKLEAMGVKPRKLLPMVRVGDEEVEVTADDAGELPTLAQTG